MVADGFDGHVEEFDFAVGSVQGVRGFNQDSLGRLTGVTYPRVFKPGVNTATCGSGPTDDIADHSCGFYGYFDPEETARLNFYGGTHGAIVRGYGRTVIGTKGFRAEKADLVAFFPIETVDEEPKKEAPTVERRPSLFRFLYPTAAWFLRRSHNFKGATAILSALVAVALLFMVLLGLFSQHFEWLPLLAPAQWLYGWFRRSADALSPIDEKDLLRACRPGNYIPVSESLPKAVSADTDPFARLRVLYPDVPVYATFQEAVAAHPLTPPEEHQLPEPSPDDPDFWTRDATQGEPFNNGGILHLPSSMSGVIAAGSVNSYSISPPVSQSLPNFTANRGPITFASGGAIPPRPPGGYPYTPNANGTACVCPTCVAFGKK
jgi:hypothetical protein